jgi:CAAX protease family protein
MTRRPGTWFAVTSAAALTAYNNLLGLHPWHRRWYAVINAGAAGAAVAAARASGLTAADLGLGRGAWRPGRPAGRLAAAAAASWLIAAAVPAPRPLLADQRVTAKRDREVGYALVVRIPAGTVLWEEVAFRGVLQAALRRVTSQRAAVAATAAVFGLWHIRPTAEALRANGLTSRPGRAAANLVCGIAATTAGGFLLSWLRESSGGLAGPMLLHLATNDGGQLAAWVAGRLAARQAAGAASARAGAGALA